MVQGSRSFGLRALLGGACFCLLTGVVLAQQAPVAAMFASDQKQHAKLAASFVTVDVPATRAAAFPLRVYLSAGDLERAFDRSEFRPDGAIVPTNTDLLITAAEPATQRILVDRVRRQPEVWRDLEDQIGTRRAQPRAAAGEAGLLRVGIDAFVMQLPRRAANAQAIGAFPKNVCLIATDYAAGGAIDHRELFAQDRVRKGIAACLTALDAAGVHSVVLPLVGASSGGSQQYDPAYEGQRVLKECRLINSAAGIALGVHDFAAGRRNLREVGIVQWDKEIADMFTPPEGSARLTQAAENAYRTYAGQVTQAVRKGLAGNKTVPGDASGNCSAIFSAQ